MSITLMKEAYSLMQVDSWVEDFNSATRDTNSRQKTCANFVLLPEIETNLRQILDQIYRGSGRGFLVTGLYGSGKTIFMAYLSAILSEPALLKTLLDKKAEWWLEGLLSRKYLTVNFTAIGNQELTLEEALWDAVEQTFSSLTPSITASISNIDIFLDKFNALSQGTRTDVELWLQQHRSETLETLQTYDKSYQKAILDQALSALNIRIKDVWTTTSEKVHIVLDLICEQGYHGIAIFIDELYLYLIKNTEALNEGTNFLSLLAQAGLAEGKPFWIFGAVQEQLSSIVRLKGQDYNAELMGRLTGKSSRFLNISLPLSQFHRIYNHRLFRANSKKVHVLAQQFKEEIQPYYRGSFGPFLQRYFRGAPLTDEATHFAELYPIHPLALYCLTMITNHIGRTRGALGFVDEFCRQAANTERPWGRVACLDDVFDYEDLRNKIIQDDPAIACFYNLFNKFCSTTRDEVLSRNPYRRQLETRAFAKETSERLIKALIILAIVKEELSLSGLNDALLLRWPDAETDPALSDEQTFRLLRKIEQCFPPLRHKGTEENPVFYLTIEGEGEEREELLNEIDRTMLPWGQYLYQESAYRAHLGLFLQFPGSPLRDESPPQKGLKSLIEVSWQRTKRQADYMLEAIQTVRTDSTTARFVKEVPSNRSLHLLLLYPFAETIDEELARIEGRDGRVLIWVPALLEAQDVDVLRRSMALVKLHGEYRAQVQAGGATPVVRRKLDIIGEMLGLSTGTSQVQPSKEAAAVLQRVYTNGSILCWNAGDASWERLFDPRSLLAIYNGIPASVRSLQSVVERLADTALTSVHPFHPNFQEIYSSSADLSSIMRKRLVNAIWQGHAAETEQAKKDIEKYLAPLGLADMSRSTETVITLSTNSHECFLKIRERVKDRIRKSSGTPREISAPDLRLDLMAKDTGLKPEWVDITLTLLLSLGEISGITEDGQLVSTDNKESIDIVRSLATLSKLRPGTRPDQALWEDLVESLKIMRRWEGSSAYSSANAEALHQAILQASEEAQQEQHDVGHLLARWSEASIPPVFIDQVDLFNISDADRSSHQATFRAVRDALRDIPGLPADDDTQQAGRYEPVSQWVTELQAARDFIERVRELVPIAERLGRLRQYRLPEALEHGRQELQQKLDAYVCSGGKEGTWSQIRALWKDFQDTYFFQYVSEYTGFFTEIQRIRHEVMRSEDYQALEKCAQVPGLSAYYNPSRIFEELQQQLEKFGIHSFDIQEGNELRQDIETHWICSRTGFRIGSKLPVKTSVLVYRVRKGLKEYLDTLRGFKQEIQAYVVNSPEADPLLELLKKSVSSETINHVLAEEPMREHVSKALENAKAERLSIDQILEELKPELLGFYKGGAEEFRSRARKVMEERLAQYRLKSDKPLKVE